MGKIYQPQDDLRFFPLIDREPYLFGVGIAADIRDGLVGRTIFTNHDAGVLAQAAANGKHGDHVEIGTFFGASAILVALMKKHFGFHGMVHCVDPFEYVPGKPDDQPSGEQLTLELVKKNARQFGVYDRIVFHPTKSKPWPLENKNFATGYIDGDHWNGMPLHDWNILKEIVSYSIIFDDYCIGKPEVMMAVETAIADPEWLPIHISGLQVVLRRRA